MQLQSLYKFQIKKFRSFELLVFGIRICCVIWYVSYSQQQFYLAQTVAKCVSCVVTVLRYVMYFRFLWIASCFHKMGYGA